MSNNTTVSVSALAGSLVTIMVFVALRLGLEIPADVASALTVLVGSALGLVLPRAAKSEV